MREDVNGAPRPPEAVAELSRDSRRIVWVTLLPLLFPVLITAGTVVDDNRGSWFGDVVVWWNLIGILGVVVYVPSAALSLIGAGILRRRFRFGRWLATLGGAAVALVTGALVLGFVAEFVDPPEFRDSTSWTSPLPLPGTILVTVPYAAIAGANVYALVRLWRRR